jgi:hypothetical protein
VVLDNATVTVHSATDFQIFGSATVRGGQYFMDNYQTILDTANMFIQNSDTMLRFYQGCDYSGADSFKVVHPSLGSFAVPFGVDSGAAYQGIIPTGANWRAPGGSGCGGNANRDFKWTYFALFNPLRSDAYENPTLYVTNDHTWKTYERPGAKDLADSSYTCYAPQPLLYIDSVGGTQNSDHLSDPRGFPNHLGQFAVIFRSKVGNNYRLWGTTSNDLVTFNQADTFPLTAASTTIDYLSPFFLWDKGNYYLFYGDAVADSVIWYRVTWPMSKRFDTVWAGTTVAVNLVTTAQPWPQAGMTPWHGAAKSLGRYAYALFCGCTKATPAGGAGASNLYLYTSADMGRNWTLRTAPILTYGKTYFDSSGIYEADFDFYHDGRKLSMDVLYSTKPWVGDWRICYSTIQLNPRVNYEFVTWAGTPPHDSEFTTVPYRDGNSFYVLRDSTSTGIDTGRCASVITIEKPCIIDSILINLKTNGKVDSLALMGPDRSGADNNTDSLYWSSTTDLGGTSLTNYGYAVKGMTGIGAQKNDRFVLVVTMYHADVSDRTILKQAVLVTREL